MQLYILPEVDTKIWPGWLDREDSGDWREYFALSASLYRERIDAARFPPGAGDLGFVIPMPRYVCPGGSRSLRGLFSQSAVASVSSRLSREQ
jgi:hypothetical protein